MYKFMIISIFCLFSSCNLISEEKPTNNDLLDFNSPIPLTGLSQYRVSIFDKSKRGNDQINIAENVDFTMNDSEFFIHMEPLHRIGRQRVYDIILESTKPIIIDKIDSITIDFKLDVIVDPENPHQLSTDDFLIREDIDIRKNNETKYTTVVSNGVIDENVNDFFFGDNTAFFHVRIRIQSVISGYPANNNTVPYVYSRADYRLHFKMDGFYK